MAQPAHINGMAYPAAAFQNPGPGRIAGAAELEAFSKQPAQERRVGEALRGVLAETATTGVVRYSWSLLRPLIEHLMEQVLREYDAESAVDIGPPRPTGMGGVSTPQTIERFRMLLSGFCQAPWTLQRICEILLEPRKQYSQLHKVALALEKCLLVSSEITPSAGVLPPPLLSSLGPVNENPPSVYQPEEGQAHGPRSGRLGARAREDVEDSSAFTGSLLDIRTGMDFRSSQVSAAPAHMEEDHWPEERSVQPVGGTIRVTAQSQPLHQHVEAPAPVEQASQQSSPCRGDDDASAASQEHASSIMQTEHSAGRSGTISLAVANTRDGHHAEALIGAPHASGSEVHQAVQPGTPPAAAEAATAAGGAAEPMQVDVPKG